MNISFPKKSLPPLVYNKKENPYIILLLVGVLALISILSFIYFYQNGLGLAYNDARSHLDIGRRVVEGLNPGFAQIGSVWLPLTHLLMVTTIWNDFMWHSGLAGALWSMIAFVTTGILIYLFLKELGVGMWGRLLAVALFATNINILYLQSTAMTELMLLSTMMAGAYCLLLWFQHNRIFFLVQSAFWIMLSTLVRYDGWFLLVFAALLIMLYLWKTRDYATAEGLVILFSTLASFGIVLWLLWNTLIFKDPLYFAFGPYSAHTQQNQLENAGQLPTKGDWFQSTRIYLYALAYNCHILIVLGGFLGAFLLWTDKRLSGAVRLATVVLMASLLFNILALYLGHSVLFIHGLSGTSWFNVRYGIMMLPAFVIFIGYLIERLSWKPLRLALITSLVLSISYTTYTTEAVTIADARYGSSQKNVSEVAGWLHEHAAEKKGFILISAASHDSIIFSSGLPMKRFIHEGSGVYYDTAIINPDRWARWIVVRTHSMDDSTWRALGDNPGLDRYQLVNQYPFADIYELKPEYLPDLMTEPVLRQKWAF